MYQQLQAFGCHAIDKKTFLYPRSKEAIRSYLEGLKADAHINTSGSITYGTISEKLKLDLRILNRILGKSVHERLWELTRTQFGKNDIWMVTVRNKREVLVKVESIVPFGNRPVYDIEVEDNQIYLPENDCVVHNCDDGALLIATLLTLSGTPIYRVKICCGYVQTPKGKIGHAYCIYLADDDEWYVLDWCFWAKESIQVFKKKNHSERKNRYLDIWFTFNNQYTWAQKDTILKKKVGGIKQQNGNEKRERRKKRK